MSDVSSLTTAYRRLASHYLQVARQLINYLIATNDEKFAFFGPNAARSVLFEGVAKA